MNVLDDFWGALDNDGALNSEMLLRFPRFRPHVVVQTTNEKWVAARQAPASI